MVLIGLGSNQGESQEIILRAMDLLGQFAVPGSYARSSLWRTSPVDCPPESGDFINAAVSFSPIIGLTPEGLLVQLKRIEREYGRERNIVRNAPRELDLDLLLYNAEIRTSEEFTLPHPRARDRLFVLAPANEVAPNAQWPGLLEADEVNALGSTLELAKTTVQLLDKLETDEHVASLELVT